MENLLDIQLKSLSQREIEEIDGGMIALAIASAGLGLAVLYYAGYAVGRLTCDC